MNKNNTSENKLFDPRKCNRPAWIAAFFVAFITFIVYLPALQNGFVNWDDNIMVYGNDSIKSIDIDFLKKAMTGSVGLWIPLTLLSIAFDYAMWGLNPMGYHLTNILFHILNTFLVFTLAIRLIRHGNFNDNKVNKEVVVAATVTAILFGIHPIHVESVAWVTERKDVLYAFFFLLTLHAYLKYTFADSKRLNYYLLSILFFIFALMSKPMAISLPLVLMVLDFYPLKRLTIKGELRNLKMVLIEKLPFFFLSFLLSLVTVLVAHLVKEEVFTLGIFKERIFMAMTGYAFIFYLVKIGLPFQLAPLYPRPSNLDYSVFQYAGYLTTFTVISLFSVWLLKRNKAFSAVWFYYVLTLIPVIEIFGAVGVAMVSDRYAYLPSVGFFLLVGLGVGAIFERCKKKRYWFIIIGASILLSSLLGLKTMRQTAVWKDSITLWSHEIKIFPGLALPYYNRGLGYDSSGAYQEAIRDFSKAIEFNHRHASAYNNRGVAYGVIGNYQQALKDFEKVIELDPKNITVYNNSGSAYYSMGNYSQAVEDYKKAVKFDPKNAKAYYNLGLAYSQLGDMGQALINYKKAAALGLKEASNPPPPSSSSGNP